MTDTTKPSGRKQWLEIEKRDLWWIAAFVLLVVPMGFLAFQERHDEDRINRLIDAELHTVQVRIQEGEVEAWEAHAGEVFIHQREPQRDGAFMTYPVSVSSPKAEGCRHAMLTLLPKSTRMVTHAGSSYDDTMMRPVPSGKMTIDPRDRICRDSVGLTITYYVIASN